MNALGISRMPTSTELRSVDFTWLDSLISRNGGLVHWANTLELDMKKKIVRVSDDEIPERINKVKILLSIDRMPSRSEIISLEGNESLHNRICDLGYRYWADKLGLEIKESETKLGQSVEDIAINMLQEKGYSVERMTTKYPFDLLINDNIRVDVKSGRAYDLRGSRCHTFGINKKYGNCDIYLIYALSEIGEVERIFVIPSSKLRIITMSIGKTTKYDIYKDRWDYLDTYDSFYKNII